MSAKWNLNAYLEEVAKSILGLKHTLMLRVSLATPLMLQITNIRFSNPSYVQKEGPRALYHFLS